MKWSKFVILQAHRNLSQLPNFAFSVPLAMFHQATADGKDLGQADAMVGIPRSNITL